MTSLYLQCPYFLQFRSLSQSIGKVLNIENRNRPTVTIDGCVDDMVGMDVGYLVPGSTPPDESVPVTRV